MTGGQTDRQTNRRIERPCNTVRCISRTVKSSKNIAHYQTDWAEGLIRYVVRPIGLFRSTEDLSCKNEPLLSVKSVERVNAALFGVSSVTIHPRPRHQINFSQQQMARKASYKLAKRAHGNTVLQTYDTDLLNCTIIAFYSLNVALCRRYIRSPRHYERQVSKQKCKY